MNHLNSAFQNLIISSRIRLARNVAVLPRDPSPSMISKLAKEVYSALQRMLSLSVLSVEKTEIVKLAALKEKFLISQNLIDSGFGFALISKDEKTSIMVGEEDHLRIQCFSDGFDLQSCHSQAAEIDVKLSKKMDYAYSDELGFLTNCKTNLGTGLRASLLMFLPALTLSQKIIYIIDELSLQNITVRGVYGEGSDTTGCLFQISNQATSNLSCPQILELVETAAINLARTELLERERLTIEESIPLQDKIFRAYGILTHAKILSSDEFMSLFALFKLGVSLKLIPFLGDEKKLDEIIIKQQKANITLSCGRTLTAMERDIYRAEYIRETLKKGGCR